MNKTNESDWIYSHSRVVFELVWETGALEQEVEMVGGVLACSFGVYCRRRQPKASLPGVKVSLDTDGHQCLNSAICGNANDEEAMPVLQCS